jgi:hypothetical protein
VVVAIVFADACAGPGSSIATSPEPALAPIEKDSAIQAVVSRMDFTRFKTHIRNLTLFGDRLVGDPRNPKAVDWLETALRGFGYANVTRHQFVSPAGTSESIYATKVGSSMPQEMYIVSAHLDGRGGGEAADDDASGCAVILELARVLATADIRLERSVRFIFWNGEEPGLFGSTAYVADRAKLQGVERPPGSGQYPEPRWLGMIQHDMVLFDHGHPYKSAQIPDADVDIEYQRNSKQERASLTLASVWQQANTLYAPAYHAQVGSNMNNTDSRPFQNLVAAISVRENQRIREIGAGSNPRYHQSTDLYTSYSEADFRFGFTTAQTSLGGVAHLAGLKITRVP